MFADDLFGEFRDHGKSTKINRPKFSLVLVYTHIQELSLKKNGNCRTNFNSANFILKGKPRTLIAVNISRFTVYCIIVTNNNINDKLQIFALRGIAS